MNTKTLQMAIRILGAIALLVGVVFWIGDNHALIRLHILLGGLLTIALFMLTYQAQRAGVSMWLVALAAIWTLGLPIWGLAQSRIFPPAYEWLAQVLHVLCAVGAICIAEIMAAQMRKKIA
jgi:hypothetical protein